MNSPFPALALIGDIHGRYNALMAVLAAARARGITDGICTGDIVMRGPEPSRCIAQLRTLGWPTVTGNTDRKVAAGNPRPPEHAASSRVGSRSWSYRRLGEDEVEWLKSLPLVVRLAFGGARVVVTHGDADSMPVAINADTSNRELQRQLRAFDADILVLGHTHMAMLRTVRNGIVINPGAVGESRNPDWQPRWGWLEATPDGVVAHLEIVDHPLAPQRDDAPED
jgi:predicted phosphodiesterase